MSSKNPPSEIVVERAEENTDNYVVPCQEFILEVVNTTPSDRVVCLLVMFTGLPFEVNAENEEPFCRYEKRSEFCLTKKVLTAEAKC